MARLLSKGLGNLAGPARIAGSVTNAAGIAIQRNMPSCNATWYNNKFVVSTIGPNRANVGEKPALSKSGVFLLAVSRLGVHIGGENDGDDDDDVVFVLYRMLF
ncbi:hypothetical protein SBOR_2378 [Sclerotinia borealis F-4128]|uniref:Uncharacterized protein n=1 Tax=Sclerotinia borealis (strain F-4128) TaxID=1432307 RepID=W9CRX8_SCLBF|nr:hypothetical protein SBOR_2378 [Sclerotinia borealis F-4128]